MTRDRLSRIGNNINGANRDNIMKQRAYTSKNRIASATPKAQPASKQLPGKLVVAILLAFVSIAIVVIYIHDWPRVRATASAPAPINLARTGVSPEIEAAINGRFPNTSSVPITPDAADRIAGMPMDPAASLAPYGVPMPQFHQRNKIQADEHKAAAGTSKSKAH
jgi:hypothetical protein